MRRRTKILLLMPIAGLVVLAAAAAWLTGTAAGARWLIARAADEVSGTLAVDGVEGSLAGGLQLEGVLWADEGFRVSVPQATLRVGLSTDLRTIVIHPAVLESPELRFSVDESDPDEPPPVLADSLGGLSSPLRLDFRRLEARSVRILDATGDVLLTIDRAEAVGVWHRNIEDLELVVVAAGGEARARGRIDLVEVDDHELELTARIDGTRLHESLPDDLSFDGRLSGDGRVVEFGIRSARAGLEGGGTLVDWHFDPAVDAELALAEWTLVEGEAAVTLNEAVARVVGRLASYEVRLGGDLRVPTLPPLKLALRGDGDAEGLRVSALELDGEFLRMKGDGAVTWGEAPRMEAALEWRDLRWPPSEQPVLWTSALGQARLSGLPDDWTAQASFELDTPDYPGGRFEVGGKGDLDGGRFEILQGDALGGSLSGSAEVAWSEATRVTAKFRAEALDLGAVLPDWPAQLDADGRFDYESGEREQLALELEHLAGSLHGEPLAGAGAISRTDGRWQAKELELRAGVSMVRVDGSRAGPGGLALTVDIRRPGWLASLVGGNVRGSARIAPDAAWPLLELDVEASDLRHGDLSIGRVVGVESEGRIEVIAENLQWDQRTLTPSRIILTGDAEGQRGELRLGRGDLEVSAVMEGALSDWRDWQRAEWAGQLKSLTLRQGDRVLVGLRDPAALNLSADAYRLDRACLSVDGDGALCVGGSYSEPGGFALEAEIETVPLSVSRLVLEHDLELTQNLDGSLGWRMEPGLPPNGFADLRLSPGHIMEIGSEEAGLETGEGRLGFQLDRGKLTGGQFDVPFPGRGLIDVDFTIDDVALDGTGRIDGKADVQFNDLSLFEPVTELLDDIRGDLESRLRISGTTADPKLAGRFTLSDAAFDVPAVGASVRDLEFSGAVDDSDELVLRGSFAAGDGSAQLRALANFSTLTDIELRTRVTGEGLLLTNLPDLTVVANPDLTLDRVDEVWRVGGRVVIPSARISPLTNFVTRVGESPDLEQISGPPRSLDQDPARQSLVLGGEVGIVLGDDVRLQADVANLGLTGELNLAWRGAKEPFADGTVDVNGDLSVWGPRLTITSGRVSWRGVPVGNPALDVIAERDVFGNTVVHSAGVRVGGTGRRPDVEAFTRPLTTRERAWAVLITGSDVQLGQGVGALDVGTYIGPRLFLSYGISLFDTENVVGLRYDLRRGWGVKVTSGQRASGIDLSYTIEQEPADESDD